MNSNQHGVIMELTLNTNVERVKTNAFAFLKSKHAKVPLFILLVLANCSFAYAGSDDGAFGDIDRKSVV